MDLPHERDIENYLDERMTEFMLGLGHGFAYVGSQYNVVVDGDDCYIGILMYHLKLHCYVVVKLEAVEFIPEFVSKLNFYISAVDEYVKKLKVLENLLFPSKSAPPPLRLDFLRHEDIP